MAGTNRAVTGRMDFLFALFIGWEKVTCIVQNNSVRKIVNDRLFNTLVSAVPSGTVWVDAPSPSVVSEVARNVLLNSLYMSPYIFSKQFGRISYLILK